MTDYDTDSTIAWVNQTASALTGYEFTVVDTGRRGVIDWGTRKVSLSRGLDPGSYTLCALAAIKQIMLGVRIGN